VKARRRTRALPDRLLPRDAAGHPLPRAEWSDVQIMAALAHMRPGRYADAVRDTLTDVHQAGDGDDRDG
jgi:hypothetical protein